MSFFKYLFIPFLFLISTFTHSAYTCGVNASVTLSTNLDDFPSTICANVGGNNCLVSETHSIKTSTGWTVYAKSTGEACSSPTNLNSTKPPPPKDGCTRLPNGSITCPEEPETPDDSVLVCTADSCANPDNKRCPSGYVRGSYNGQSICAKSSKPDPENPDPDPNPSTGEIIGAIDQANSDINGSLGNLMDSLSGMFDGLTNALKEIASKLSNGNNSGSDGGDDETDGDVDTSGMEADIPIQTPIKPTFKENLFVSNAQCPPDNVLSLNFLGKSFTHRFSYIEICNALNMLSFLIMCFAYLFGCYILVKT